MNNREEFKFILIGNQNVGKTSLIKKYINGTFKPNQCPTSSANCVIKDIIYNQKKLRLNIWDTAGQEKYNSLVTPFFRDSQGVIVVCDLSDETTVEPTKKWIQEARDRNFQDIPIIFLGNKRDIAKPEIRKHAKDLANEYHYQYFETSAQDDETVDDVFLALVEKAMNMVPIIQHEKKPQEKHEKKSCCS